MKIIDLLNKIAKGEEVPERIKYFGLEYEYCNNCKQYEHVDIGVRIKLFEEIVELNDEVEIIEKDKKIKKIDFRTLNTQKEKNRVMKDTINQIIDKLNERDEDV